ncbi:MAG: AAA family ATPase [Pirellulaceae bacterium]
MYTDLTSLITSQPDHSEYYSSVSTYGTPTHNPDDIRKLLRSIPHTEREKAGRLQFDLESCPFCHQAEGNPAVLLQDGHPAFKCHREKSGCSTKTFQQLERLLTARLPIISASEMVTRYTTPRPDIITGLLRRGDVANIIGGPKARKSFLVMQLALSVASGSPFFGRPTVRNRVLMIDNELRQDDLSRRVSEMSRAMGVGIDGIDIMPLRGKLADAHAIRAELLQLRDTYGLIVIDALYKALPSGTDENSNSNMTAVYTLLDDVAERTNSALSIVHHTSKGAQKAKSVTDMGAGAGAQSRSADVHIVLRDHEDDNTVVMEAVTRSQSPPPPLCIEFTYPLWRVVDKDPAQVAITSNKKASPTMAEFLETIPDEPTRKSDVLTMSKKILNTSKTGIDALMAEAIKRGEVQEEKPRNPRLPYTVRRVRHES